MAQPAARPLGWLDLGPGWLFEHMRDAVAIVDARGLIRLWNPAAEHLFGHAATDILGQSIDQVLPRLTRAVAFDRPTSMPLERVGRHASGADVQVEIAFSEVGAPGSTEPLVLLTVRDISARSRAEREIAERRRTERALIESEERLQRALATQRFLDDASNELAASLDYDITLRRIASLALPRLGDVCVVFGLDEELSLEQVAASHIDPEQEHGLAPLLACSGHYLGQAALHERAQLMTDFAGPVWAALACSPAARRALDGLRLRAALLVPLVSGGRVGGLMLLGSTTAGERWLPASIDLAEDLARRCALALENARLYRTAQHAIAARDQFLSIASHELRAPLARLKSHAEVLLQTHDQEQLDPERLRWSVERINAAVDRLARLTKDVLDLSRLRGGHLPFRPRTVDLRTLLSDLEPRFGEVIGAHHELRLEVPADECRVLVDQDRVEQILVNLLDNAAKYSPGGGTITLRLAARDDGALLSVHDDGVGLPDGADEVIFEAFGRAANAEAWNVPGMGLGLHICRLIVERHGGRIWAESAGEQRGTTVSVWLPYAAESPMSSGEARERLSNQLTLAVGYCELLATSPDLPPRLRAQALGAMHGAQGAAATLEDL